MQSKRLASVVFINCKSSADLGDNGFRIRCNKTLILKRWEKSCRYFLFAILFCGWICGHSFSGRVLTECHKYICKKNVGTFKANVFLRCPLLYRCRKQSVHQSSFQLQALSHFQVLQRGRNCLRLTIPICSVFLYLTRTTATVSYVFLDRKPKTTSTSFCHCKRAGKCMMRMMVIGQLLVNSTIAVNINSRVQMSKENLEYIYWQGGLTEKNLNMGLRRSAMKCSSVGRIKTDGKCTNAAAPFVPLCACHPLCLSQTTFERVTNAWKTGGGKKSLAECNFSVQWEMRRKQTETLPCVTTMIFFSSQQWCLLWQVHPRFCLFTQSR